MLPALLAAGASLLGGMFSEQGKNKELAQQKEFAQQGVRWRVEDARAAGIHPAVAMGASVPSYTPVGLGSGMAEGLAGAGQDISRAIDATSTLPEKGAASQLALENMGLQNDLLRAQIIGLTRPSTPPFPLSSGDYPIPGQPASGVLSTVAGNLKLGPHSPAEKAESEYGEIAGEVQGLSRLVHDLAAAGLSVVPKPGTRSRYNPNNAAANTHTRRKTY